VVVRARTALLLLLLLTGLLLAACGVAASGNQPGDLTGSQTGAAVDGAAGGGPGAAGAASSGSDPSGSDSPASDSSGSASSGLRCTIASGWPSQDCTPSALVVTVRGRAATSVPARTRSAGSGPASGPVVRACAIVVRVGAPTPTGCPVTGPTKGPLPVTGTATVPVTGPPTYPGGCSPLFFGTPPGPVSSGWTCPAPTYRDCYVNGVLTACPPVPVSEPPSATRYPTGTAPS